MADEPKPRGFELSCGLRRRAGWGAMVLLVVLAVLYWAESGPSRWEWLGVSRLDPVFADWSAVLAAGQAHAAGSDPFKVPSRFDAYGRPHVYGPGWWWTGSVGLTVADTFWTGGCLVLLFLGGIVFYLFAPRDCRTAGLTLALLLSPPVVAALNRANNDLAIILMFVGAAWLAGRSRGVHAFAAAVLLAAMASLKFYPVVLVAVFLAFSDNRRHIMRLAGGWLLVLLISVALQWRNYHAALAALPQTKSIFAYQLSYSAELIAIIISKLPPKTWPGVVLGVLVMFSLLWWGRREWHRCLPNTGAFAVLTAGSTIIWCACLAAGPNFSYRFVWLLPLAAWAIQRRNAGSAGAWPLLFIIVVLGWAWWPKHILAKQLQGGNAAADWLLMNAVGFEQVAVLGSVVVCLWMFIGWFWRRITDLGFAPLWLSRHATTARKTPS